MDVTRIKVRLPIKSLGWVNSYLISSTLIDPGMLWGRSLLDLSRGLARADGGLCSLERVVVTHFHVDHSTASTMIYYTSGARLYIGEGDLKVIKRGVEEYIGSALQLYREAGMPGEEVEEIKKAHPALRLGDVYEEAAALDWRPLSGGDSIELGGARAEVLEAPGHTPGHILLKLPDGGIIVGDTLLPGITPHVTIHDWRDDPLGWYMESLSRIAGMGASIAYPGHRDPIQDPAARAREILEHHKSRLAEVLSLLREGPLTGYDLARRIRWRTRYSSWGEYPAPERFFAMGEALAHIRRLEVEGLVEEVDVGGVRGWRLA